MLPEAAHGAAPKARVWGHSSRHNLIYSLSKATSNARRIADASSALYRHRGWPPPAACTGLPLAPTLAQPALSAASMARNEMASPALTASPLLDEQRVPVQVAAVSGDAEVQVAPYMTFGKSLRTLSSRFTPTNVNVRVLCERERSAALQR